MWLQSEGRILKSCKNNATTNQIKAMSELNERSQSTWKLIASLLYQNCKRLRHFTNNDSINVRSKLGWLHKNAERPESSVINCFTLKYADMARPTI